MCSLLSGVLEYQRAVFVRDLRLSYTTEKKHPVEAFLLYTSTVCFQLSWVLVYQYLKKTCMGEQVVWI